MRTSLFQLLSLRVRELIIDNPMGPNFFKWGKGPVEAGTHEQDSRNGIFGSRAHRAHRGSKSQARGRPSTPSYRIRQCLEDQRQDTEFSRYGQGGLAHGRQLLLIGELYDNDRQHNVLDLSALHKSKRCPLFLYTTYSKFLV